MTDYNLVMLPVLDEDERMVGVITVDDVLELTLPTGWRRRFGVVQRLTVDTLSARWALTTARRKEAGMDREQPRSTQPTARPSGPSLLA